MGCEISVTRHPGSTDDEFFASVETTTQLVWVCKPICKDRYWTRKHAPLIEAWLLRQEDSDIRTSAALGRPHIRGGVMQVDMELLSCDS